MSSDTNTAKASKAKSADSADSSGMNFLESNQRKLFATYLPLGGFLFEIGRAHV